MKRKFLSFLMLGALVIASTSLTSCKDYDDDIQNLQNQITTNLKALEDAKADLQGKISALQGRIEAAEAQIAANKTAIDGLRTDVNKNAEAIAKLQGQVADNAAKIAALEARMATAEQALKAYIGDDRQQRCNHVGAVEPATHTHFYNCYINFLASEIVKRHPHRHLKERQLQFCKHAAVPFHKINHLFLRYHLSIYTYTLPEVHKVRRRVQANLVASLLKY